EAIGVVSACRGVFAEPTRRVSEIVMADGDHPCAANLAVELHGLLEPFLCLLVSLLQHADHPQTSHRYRDGPAVAHFLAQRQSALVKSMRCAVVSAILRDNAEIRQH